MLGFFFSGWRTHTRQKSRGMFLARGKCQQQQCMQLLFFRRSKLLLLLYLFEGKSYNWWIEMGFAGEKWALTVTPEPVGLNKVFLIPSGWVQLEPNPRLGLFIFDWAPDRCSAADMCALPSNSSSSWGVNFCLCTCYLNYNVGSFRIIWPKG